MKIHRYRHDFTWRPKQLGPGIYAWLFLTFRLDPKPVNAYWFSQGDEVRFDSTIRAKVGVTHDIRECKVRWPKPVKLCAWGYHASMDIVDAVLYAPGERLWRVELDGPMEFGHNKLVAQRRKYVKTIEATPIWREFLRRIARAEIKDKKDAEVPYMVRKFVSTGQRPTKALHAIANWVPRDSGMYRIRRVIESLARTSLDVNSNPLFTGYAAWHSYNEQIKELWQSHDASTKGMLRDMVNEAFDKQTTDDPIPKDPADELFEGL